MVTDTRSQFELLIGEFGEGWSRGDATKIARTFATEGVFVPEPFSAPIRGRAAITEYWNKIPFEQSEISFRHGEIFSVGPWFSVEFKCTFRRRRGGEPVDVRGAVFCETDGDKITEMRIYYHRVVRGA